MNITLTKTTKDQKVKAEILATLGPNNCIMINIGDDCLILISQRTAENLRQALSLSISNLSEGEVFS